MTKTECRKADSCCKSWKKSPICPSIQRGQIAAQGFGGNWIKMLRESRRNHTSSLRGYQCQFDWSTGVEAGWDYWGHGCLIQRYSCIRHFHCMLSAVWRYLLPKDSCCLKFNNVDDNFFCSPFRLFPRNLACNDNHTCTKGDNGLAIDIIIYAI